MEKIKKWQEALIVIVSVFLALSVVFLIGISFHAPELPNPVVKEINSEWGELEWSGNVARYRKLFIDGTIENKGSNGSIKVTCKHWDASDNSAYSEEKSKEIYMKRDESKIVSFTFSVPVELPWYNLRQSVKAVASRGN